MIEQHAGTHGKSGFDRVTPAGIGAADAGHTHAGLGGASVWTSGTGVPAGGSGTVGDWYLDDANGNVYEKTGSSTWTLRDNLTGPTGTKGDTGSTGAKGDTGNTGATGTSGWAYGVVDGSPTLADSGTVTIGVTSGDRAFALSGQRVRCYKDATHYMEGIITSWSSPTMQFTADYKVGTGTIVNPYVFLTGDRGATGATGSQGPQGDAGLDGADAVAGKLPSSYVEMTTTRTTTSASLVDVTGATTTITLEEAVEIAAFASVHWSGDGICDLGVALNINSVDHDEQTIHIQSSTDSGNATIVHRSAELAAGTYTVKLRFRRISGGPKIPEIDRCDLLVMAMQGAKGVQGEQGIQGIQGEQGAQGETGAAGVGTPTGSILAWAGGTGSPPSGFLVCNGASLLRADYAALFAVIGTTYGSADGTHFTLPDLGQKFLRGWKTGDTLGATGGAGTHTHAAHAVHSHPSGGNTGAEAAHTHSGSGNTGAEASHIHSGNGNTGYGGDDHTHGVGGNTNAASAGSTQRGTTTSTLTLSNHVHGISLTSGSASTYSHVHASGAVGAGSSHAHTMGSTAAGSSHLHTDPATANNSATQSHDTPSHLPDYIIVPYIIKT